MVAALAADLISADYLLSTKPAALRSIIMATALHNIEGDARLSDWDGVGNGVEEVSYAFSNANSDYLGLVVYSKVRAPAAFNVCLASYAIFLPLIQK